MPSKPFALTYQAFPTYLVLELVPARLALAEPSRAPFAGRLPSHDGGW
jgi:hypothetical protein